MGTLLWHKKRRWLNYLLVSGSFSFKQHNFLVTDALQEADFKVMSLKACNDELNPAIKAHVTKSNICARSEKSTGCTVNESYFLI